MGQCADFLATDVGVAGLCRMNSVENEGVITYDDGHVAVTTNHNPGQPDGFYIQPPPADKDRTPIRLDLSATVIARMKALQGDEFGDCTAQGMGSKFSFSTLSSSIDWSVSTKSDIRRLVWGSKAAGRPNLVITCSDATYQGLTGINNVPANRQLYVDAFNALKKSCSPFDGPHCEALRESLRLAAGLPTDSEDSIWHKFLLTLAFGAAGLPVLLLAFGTNGIKDTIGDIAKLARKIKNKVTGKKDDDDKPQGGGKGSDDRMVGFKQGYAQGYQDGVRAPASDAAQNQVKRSFPALATENEGALIYRYQAFIDGVRVGLPANLARLDGQTFTSEAFASASGMGSQGPSADDTVRSLNLKGPQVVAVKMSARISSADEAAAVAADHMVSGASGDHVTAFGASGGSIGVEVPVVRVVPVPVLVP